MTRQLVRAVATLLLVSWPAVADLMVLERRRTDATEVAGRAQPAVDEVIRYSFGEQRVRRQEKGTTVLLRFDEQKMFLVDDSDRTVTEVALPIDLPSLVPEEMRPTLDMMLQSMSMQAIVTPHDESRMIGAWKARRYDIEMTSGGGLAMRVTMWVSTDLPIDQGLFNRSVEALTALVPGSQSWIDQLLAIPGIPVQRDTLLKIMGSEIHTVETIEQVEDFDPPPGHYDPPADYAPKPFDLGETLQRAAP